MILERDGGAVVRLRRCDLIVWCGYPMPVWVGSELASRRNPTAEELGRCLEWMGAEQVGGRLTVERVPEPGGRGVRVWTPEGKP